MKQSRQTLMASCAALLVSASFVTQAAAQEACTSMQVLLGIVPHHREDVMSYIAPRLKEKLNVDLIAEQMGSVNMVEQISAQGDRPRVSVAQWDVAVGLDACEKGLCSPIDLEKAPNAKNLYDWAYTKNADGEPTILASTVVSVGIMYNEDEFKKNNIAVPTSWADLQDPDMKGRLAITAPQSTMGTAALVMLARNAGGGEEDIDPGFDATQKIMPNVHTVFTWTSELSNLIQLGEVWAAVTSSNIAPPLRQQGIPMRFVVPEEGSPTANGGLSLVKNGPCQEAAYEYINLFYSDEFQALRMRHGGTASPSQTAWDDLTPAESEDLGISAANFDKLVHLDWEAINLKRAEWTQRWQREIR